MQRKRKVIGKLVGRINEGYYFCVDIFWCSSGLQGANGIILRPVSKEEYKCYTQGKGLLNVLEIPWRKAVERKETIKGLKEWAKEVYKNGGDKVIFDLSGSEYWGQLRKLGLNENDYPIFECVGRGRCFKPHMKFNEVYDKELWEKIKKAENGKALEVIES